VSQYLEDYAGNIFSFLSTTEVCIVNMFLTEPWLKRLTKISKIEYKCLTQVYPLHDFYEIFSVRRDRQCRVICKKFFGRFAQCVPQLRRFEYEGVWLSPDFLCLLAAKLCWIPKCFRAARTCSRTYITMHSSVVFRLCTLLGE